MESPSVDSHTQLRDLHNERTLRLVPATTATDDVIDLTHLFRIWVKWIWLPILAGGIGAWFGYQSLQSFVPESVAKMIVVPAASTSGGASLPMTGGLGAAASAFGIQIGGAEPSVSSFDRFKMILTSMQLAQRMQEKYGLMQKIWATSWDSNTLRWVRPSGEDFEREERRRAMLRQNLWTAPNLETLAAYIGGKVKVEPAKAQGFYELSVQHRDGNEALWLLNTTFAEADALLREADREQSLERRRFIERQMESRTMLYMQETLRALLTQELNKEITLEAQVSYVGTVVEPAHIMNAKTEPNLQLIFGLPIAGWAGGAFLLITLVAVIRGDRRR